MQNPVHNHLYTTHHNIAARLSRTIKTKNFNEDDIIEWCQEVETDILQQVDLMYNFLEVELTVTNYKAFLPCNIYKIMDVYTTPDQRSSRIPYIDLGSYISFDTNQTLSSIYIDYKGMPVDLDSGLPLIIRGHEMACEAYCIWKIYTEDILNDKISIDSKNRIESRKDSELAACFSTSYRFKDRARMNNEMIIMGNWVPRLANLKLSKNDIIR